MKTKLYVAIASPNDFYFLSFPVGKKINIPGSTVYTYVEFQRFLDRLIEKFPGTIRDLATTVNTHPHIIAVFSRNPEANVPRTQAFDILTEQSINELIKLYYKHVIAANPNVTFH